MAKDIEEFLRRAAERRQQQAGGGQARPPQQRQRPPARPPQRQQPPPQQPEKEKPRRLEAQKDSIYDQAEIVEQGIGGRHVLSDHVKAYVDSSDIASHAENLGDRLAQTDERVEARLKKRFDRDLSRLDDRPSVQDASAPIVTGESFSGSAKELIEMFKSPSAMKQAIIISEIMKRPEFDD